MLRMPAECLGTESFVLLVAVEGQKARGAPCKPAEGVPHLSCLYLAHRRAPQEHVAVFATPVGVGGRRGRFPCTGQCLKHQRC